jgi:Rieske Fe-S protein
MMSLGMDTASESQDKSRHPCCKRRAVPHPKASSRREFCVHASCAAASLALLGTFAGCTSPTAPTLEDHPIPSADATILIGALQLTIDSTSPLATVGNAVLVENGLGKFLVARTDQDSFVALTAVCTHFGCTIVRYDNLTYECPCHGSRFSTSGSVVRGPASAPLRQFPTQFSNGVLTISV